MNRILASALPSEINGKEALFITFASFEPRCLTSASNLPHAKIAQAIIIFNKENENPELAENLKKIVGMFGNEIIKVGVNLNDPFDVRDQVKGVLERSSPSFDQFVIDVTTFTHETLAITIDLISDRWPNSEWTILYNGAGDYDTAHKEIDEVWLSKRPTCVRSILGFSGEMHSSKKNHLFVLVGFEHERAHYAIDTFEPNKITLAKGEKKESVTPELADVNAHFYKKVDNFVKSTATTFSSVMEVAFSPTDSEKTQEIVQQVITENEGFNTIICPMNTKLSTLGVILTALQNPSVQLAYVPVDEYNEEAYAAPSKFLTVERRTIVKPRVVD